ncbi:MAG TPA: DUF2130 domain-containing protein [Steroidobacteraceae bacterium]|nr:DUF2130 domain-containing protein [Steroidobacteraceae bacterium]
MSAEPEAVHHLFLSLETRVTCPKCTSRFSLQQGFAQQALEKLEQSTEGALEAVRASERAEVSRQAQQLAAQRDKTLRAENSQLQQLLREQGEQQQRLLKAQSEQHAKALQEVRAVAEKSLAPQLEALRGELTASQARVSELRSTEITLRQQKAELADRAAALEVEVVRRVDAQRTELETRIRTQERERAELEKAELQKRLDDVHGQLAEAQRKSQQTSQQLQGEVLELTLQSGLERAFPLDSVEEVKKGARGGDVVHQVATRVGQVAGVLLWEAKRARDWSGQWVTKLKEDMRACNADVGILVITGTALPREWEPGQLFGLHEEVWVTSWTTALQLAAVLRSGLLDLHKQRLVSANKGEKMEAVYDYLTSSQFAQKLKAVYGAFYRMRQELESEKSQTLQRWARREKQLQCGLAELVGVAGDIQGLAQQDLPLLDIDPGMEADASPGSDGAAGLGAEASQLGLGIGEQKSTGS